MESHLMRKGDSGMLKKITEETPKKIATITLDVYNDPGHGWIKVPVKLLTQLKIVKQITAYSYIYRNFAFLEEDQDAFTLISALNKEEIKYKFREHNSNRYSKIRNYPKFTVFTSWGL